ncbi:MAG: hypothetical protein LBU46_01545 [Candidatus Accumulibacter sp.]|jgi:hypothetical protein|nr:hypothetical protein [Accumulibacter sp.]
MSARNGNDSSKNPAPRKRRHNFLATRQNKNVIAEPSLIEALESGALPLRKEEDLPVLTEVVPVEDERKAPVPGEAPQDSPAASDNVSLEELAARMAQAIDQQMAYELPTLIEATLLSISADLRAGIASTMEAALRDFINNYKKPPAPDEPAPKP